MYTIIDFETTGLSHKNDFVVEIAAVKLDKHLNQTASMNFFVQLPKGKRIPAKITQLTGITDKDLIHGVSEDTTALYMLKKFIDEDIVVAQFASFDLGFLSKVFKPKHFICTRSMSQILDPSERSGLADLTARYGVTLDNHHRALADVEATVEVFKVLLARMTLEGKSMDDVLDVMTQGNRPLAYIPEGAKVVEVGQ